MALQLGDAVRACAAAVAEGRDPRTDLGRARTLLRDLDPRLPPSPQAGPAQSPPSAVRRAAGHPRRPAPASTT
jgi:hypothetical protein